MNYQRELDFARRIATVAGQNATDIRARGLSVEKPDPSPVTIADKENDRLICEAIEREFPDAGILAEEGSRKAGSRVSPLDYRSHRWHTRLRPRQPILVRSGRARRSQRAPRRRGAFSHAERDVLGSARGSGSYLNNDRLHVSAIASIGDCMFSPNGLHLIAARPHLPRVMELMQRSWAVRSYGGALDACLVARERQRFGSNPKSRSGTLPR
jgi:fructose-1,6-bisphosphatase/inositol monophosphatase family enzyme